jgi:hypothetical protein
MVLKVRSQFQGFTEFVKEEKSRGLPYEKATSVNPWMGVSRDRLRLSEV